MTAPYHSAIARPGARKKSLWHINSSIFINVLYIPRFILYLFLSLGILLPRFGIRSANILKMGKKVRICNKRQIYNNTQQNVCYTGCPKNAAQTLHSQIPRWEYIKNTQRTVPDVRPIVFEKNTKNKVWRHIRCKEKTLYLTHQQQYFYKGSCLKCPRVTVLLEPNWSVNDWADMLGDHLLGPYVLPERLLGWLVWGTTVCFLLHEG